MTNSPISPSRVAAVSNEGKLPRFNYFCSKMQPETWSLIAVNAHPAPLAPSGSWAGIALPARCVPVPGKAGLFKRRDFSLAGFERDLIRLQNEIYTISFSVADTSCHDCFESRKYRLYLPFFGQLNSFTCWNYCILTKISFLSLSRMKTVQRRVFSPKTLLALLPCSVVKS